MYGLKPEDIQHLEYLLGQSLVQIAVGQYQIQFHVGPSNNGGISVEGRCELLDPTGKIIDVWEGGHRSREFLFLDQLGKNITEVKIDSAKSFVASLEDGWSLRFVDNSDQYESFSVGGLYV